MGSDSEDSDAAETVFSVEAVEPVFDVEPSPSGALFGGVRGPAACMAAHQTAFIPSGSQVNNPLSECLTGSQRDLAVLSQVLRYTAAIPALLCCCWHPACCWAALKQGCCPMLFACCLHWLLGRKALLTASWLFHHLTFCKP